MYYIVGLGNPGPEHELQRHNVGWLVLDELVRTYGLPEPVSSSKYVGRVSEGVIGEQAVTVLYPDTFMNHSGAAVKKLITPAEVEQLILIYDDVDIPLGEFKLSVGRGDGGHNGVKSVIAALGTKDFIRVRVGVAAKTFFGGVAKRPTGARLPKFVLSDFKKRELEQVRVVAVDIQQAIKTILAEGVATAMNRFN